MNRPIFNWRLAFIIIFPLFILAILYLMFSITLSRHETQQQRQKQQEWLRKADLRAARVRSEYSSERQAEQDFRDIAEHLENGSRCNDQELPELLAQAFSQHLTREIADKSMTWAFIKTRHDYELIEQPWLQTQKKRAFIRTFQALCQLAGVGNETTSNRIHERFIIGMFGENASPQHLASNRQGRLTPVVYEGKHYYLCWRVLELGDSRFIGFISLISGEFIENGVAALQRLANQLYREKEHVDNPGLTVFLKSPLLEPEFKPIMPRQVSNEKLYPELLQQLHELWQRREMQPRQLLHSSSGWLYFDYIDAETPYSIAILENPPSAQFSPAFLRTLFAGTGLLIWAIYLGNFWHNKRLALTTTFRLLFFLTGLLPVTALIIMALNFIDASAEANIKNRINQARSILRAADQQAEDVKNWCGMIIGELLKQNRLQRQLVQPATQKAGFQNFTAELKQRNYHLQYLLIFKPGQQPCYFSNLAANRAIARFHLDYFAVACESMSQLFALYNKTLPAIELSSMQKTLLGVFDNMGNAVARELFLDSIERMTYLKTGNSARNFFFNSIIIGDDGLPVYLVISINTIDTFTNMLAGTLDQQNRHGPITYACFNRNLAEQMQLLPIGSKNFIKTQAGYRFSRFMHAAASSKLGLIVYNPKDIMVYEPMLKLGAWYGGALIDISDLNREAAWRRLLLCLLIAALLLFIFVLSTAATRIFISPTGLLSGVFSAIAEGNYQQKFDYTYDNELGELATATNNMINGLKERHALGKFVSTTFDNQIREVNGIAQAQKLDGVVLFSDVRNFTTLSEANPPTSVSQMLNQHLRGMVEAINQHGGRIDQFIGDAVVAFFPGTDNSSCNKAVKAAAAMLRTHQQTIAARKQHRMFTYNIGIGLASGTVIAGALNSGSRSEFTLIGQARHNAEKLETSSKTGKHTAIIISDTLYESLSANERENFIRHNHDCFELLDLEAFA